MVENKIGQLTEIQVDSMGGVLTEGYPTYFHTFCKRKLLAKSEKATDYKEITAEEKEAIVKSDESWVAPPQSFIDQWNIACGEFGTYNAETGFFELNGLTDITYEEATTIFYYDQPKTGITAHQFESSLIRTNLPRKVISSALNLSYSFSNATKLVVANIANGIIESRTFSLCTSLRQIGMPDYPFYDINDSTSFYNCKVLEEIYAIIRTSKNIDLRYCPKLTLQCVTRLIANARNTNALTIYLHPNVYAKLTDETNSEWHELIDKASAKQITFTTP